MAAADARDPLALAAQLSARRAALLVNCAPYVFNLGVMEAALRARCHYLDLGGLFHTTRMQLVRDAEFRRRGLLAVLGMGSAPGIVNVLARAAVESLRKVHAIRIYNGGVDYTRYAAPWRSASLPPPSSTSSRSRRWSSTRGRFRAVEPLSGAEDFMFEVGLQRVHASLHSEVATLPLSYRGKGVRECFFKIAYDPVLVERLRLLIDLGLADRRARTARCRPARRPSRLLPADALAARAHRRPGLAGGGGRGRGREGTGDHPPRPDRDPPTPAPAVGGGARYRLSTRHRRALILEGRIRERGVLPPEGCVPVGPFLDALAERGLHARVTTTRDV